MEWFFLFAVSFKYFWQTCLFAGFENYDEYIDMSEFEQKDLTNLLLHIFNQIRPLYKELFGFVRARLFQRYPEELDPFGTLPMYIFGDPWAKDWRNIFDLLRPKPSHCFHLAEERLKAGNWSMKKMVKAGEEFFTSMGLWKMTDVFWKKSIFTKPKGRKIDCQPVVRDFFDGKDYRFGRCSYTLIFWWQQVIDFINTMASWLDYEILK